MPTKFVRQANIDVSGNSLLVNADANTGNSEKLRSLIPGLYESHFNVFADNFDVRQRPWFRPSQLQQFICRNALNTETAIFVLANVETRVSYDQVVDNERLFKHEPHQTDTDTHLFGRDNEDTALPTDQFSVVEFEFGPAEAPASVHAGKLNLHSNCSADPALDLILVFGNSRQKQSEQPHSDR